MTVLKENEQKTDTVNDCDRMQPMLAQVDSLLTGDIAERVKDFIRFTFEQDVKAVQCQPENS